MRSSKLLLAVMLMSAASFGAVSQPQLSFVEIMTGFDRPVDIANAGDGSNRLFIVEAEGQILIIDRTGALLPEPFLDISDKTNGQQERGLLGLAFHPDYETNGYFYINYTNLDSDTRIARYKVSDTDPDSADVMSEVILFAIDQPYNNHNGGCLKFGPNDGYLYIASGDGGSGGDPECYAQDSLDLLGKILRVDVDQNTDTPPYYGIPATNPFVGSADGADEIWAVGLRNPWKISFDRANGNLWIADVGQDVQEEVNLQLADSPGGENYGWKVMEGENCFNPDPIDPDCPTGTPPCDSDLFTDPLFFCTQTGDEDCRSLTGGYVYRGCKYPDLVGYYVAADYITGNGWLIDSLGNDIFFSSPPARISSFGEAENGELYVVTLGGSPSLYEVRDNSIPYDLEITETDNPVSGIFRAANSITLSGDIAIKPGQTLTLIAPEVIVSDSFSVDDPSVVIVETGCE